MTVSRKMRQRRNIAFRKGIVFILLVSSALLIFCVYIMKEVVEPNLEEVSRMRAQVIVSKAINTALDEQFSQGDSRAEFFKIQRDENGVMEMVTADSIAINKLIAEISLNIQKAFKNMQSEYMYIPLGSLMGSKLFSQTGPQIKVNIVPISVTSSDFRTEFEEQGINQTKYMLYIILGCEIKVLCPFAYDTIETSTKVLIAEAVILGKVPSSYVQVPEEDILDVTEQ